MSIITRGLKSNYIVTRGYKTTIIDKIKREVIYLFSKITKVIFRNSKARR